MRNHFVIDTKTTIYMDVKKLREEMGVTQQELAQMCGVSIRSVQNWEIGKPVPQQTQKLLEVLRQNRTIVQGGKPNGTEGGLSAGMVGQVTLNPDTKLFFDTLTRQQDIMSRQLQELAETRKLIQKKDEQIDALLKIIGQQ